jgi:hypothetical protein
MFPLPLDRNGKQIRFGATVEADRYRFEVSSFRFYRDGTVQVCGLLPYGYDAKECVLVEEPFAERFKPGDIVAASRFGRFGGDRFRVIGWVPERNGYAAVMLGEPWTLASIRESDNPTLVERAS